MKKHIKKIILVISLVAVLVSSMVIPSFAYENQGGGFSTWHDFMGESDLIRFPMWVSTSTFQYSDVYEIDGYYTFSYVFDPFVLFGNIGYYDGNLAFRFGGDPMQNTYSLELGYLDISPTSVNRYQRVSTCDYNVTAEIYYLNDYYAAYLGGYLYDIAKQDENIFEALKSNNVTLNRNTYIVRVTVPYPSANKYIFNNGWVMMLYPSVYTFDDIYGAQLDARETLYNAWAEKCSENDSLSAENSSLRTENGNLLEENSNLTILNEQYKYEASLVPTLSAEVDTLTEQKNILQNTVDQQKIMINGLQNQLDEFESKTDPLRSLGNGIGDGFSKILDSITGLSFGNVTVGACIAVFVVIFVVFIIIKLVLR